MEQTSEHTTNGHASNDADDAAPVARNKPRKLSVTDKIHDLRLSACAALGKLRGREQRLQEELRQVQEKRMAAGAELARIDSLLEGRPPPDMSPLVNEVQPYVSAEGQA